MPAQDSFLVDIYINPSETLLGAQCDLFFDTQYLQVVEVQNGGMFDKWADYNLNIDNLNGQITDIVALNLQGNTTLSSGSLATIIFSPIGLEGTTYLTLSDVIIGDEMGEQVSTTIQNGEV